MALLTRLHRGARSTKPKISKYVNFGQNLIPVVQSPNLLSDIDFLNLFAASIIPALINWKEHEFNFSPPSTAEVTFAINHAFTLFVVY